MVLLCVISGRINLKLLTQGCRRIIKTLEEQLATKKELLRKNSSIECFHYYNEKLFSMARSLEILLFNRRLRKNISTLPNQTNQIVYSTSSAPQRNTPHNVTTTNTPSRKRSRRKNTKKPPTYNNKPNVLLDTSSVINLSNVTLTNNETQLLAKGLTFCPKPGLINWTEVSADFDEFARRMLITEFFHDHSTDNESNPFYPKNLWTAPTDRDNALNAVKHDLLTAKPKYLHDNLPKAQRRALHKLNRRHDIVIKSADKGSATVIVDRT